MKQRQQCAHDPNFKIKKYDRWGNVNPAWKAIYEKRMPKVRYPKRKPKL